MTTVLPQSKLLPFFKENRDRLKETMELVGDMLVVERIQFPENKTASGLIIATRPSDTFNSVAADMPGFYRVLMVGAGFYNDETKESVPLDIEPGDCILTGSVSVKLFSMLPMLQLAETNVIGVTRHSDIQARFKGEQALIDFLVGLNKSVQAQIEAMKAASDG